MDALTKWTVEDYHHAIATGQFSDRQIELIQQEIVEMSPEGPIHHFLTMNGADYLRSVLGQQAIISEAHPITLIDSEPEPDIAIVRPPATRYKTRHPYLEDIYWIIEIADSTLAKDLGVKKALYANAGIPEYWVIDISTTTLKVFQKPTKQDYQSAQDYRDGIVSPLAFPELKISVKKLI